MRGHVDIILDSAHGSSGKGKLSAWLAAHLEYESVMSANMPNAGHSAVMDDGTKFVAKAIPTAGILHKYGHDEDLMITPGSAFRWDQLAKEWLECDRPYIYIHDRAGVITGEHAARERSGADSTAHIASTMQGSGVWLSDKVLRRQSASLAGKFDIAEVGSGLFHGNTALEEEFYERVIIVPGYRFRDYVYDDLEHGNALFEGSQGYALSIDHGNAYPHCTSRNCTSAAALDFAGVAPQRLGDVWLNLRSYPIRVGSITEGSSGPFYPDSEELTWEEVASRAGMPYAESVALAERERTTVTKRIRRVSTFSKLNLADAVRTNGATKLCLNFIQYVNWADAGKTRFIDLSAASREFIDMVEDTAGVPVALCGTGAKQSEMIVRGELL